jgi:hypothetical protein
MYTSSSKHKLNTKSYMEAELVPIDDSMAQVILTRHLLAAQGQYILTTTIYQGNKSMMVSAVKWENIQ